MATTRSQLEDLLKSASISGLKRMQASIWPDVWAGIYGIKVDNHPYTFEGRPFLKDIIRDTSQEIVCKKSAQMGVTVSALIKALHWWMEMNWNVGYLLPVKAGTTAFTQGRINPMIESSPQLRALLRLADNANHKRTATNNLYIRGTNVQSELREIPLDAMVWDEYDKMVMDNMRLARTRLDASKHKHIFKLSTPTVPDYAISRDFDGSDQHHWFLDCLGCGTSQSPTWDDNVEVGDRPAEAFMFCEHCKREWSNADIIAMSMATGRWVAKHPGREVRGYHMNQLISPTRTIKELAGIWHDGQHDASAMRELQNSALGEPYLAEGDKLQEHHLDACAAKGYTLPGVGYDYRGEKLAVGVDVGSVLHVQASRVLPDGRRQKVVIETMHWGDLRDFLRSLDNFTCVIDAHPEKTKARELADEFRGRVFIAFYAEQIANGETLEWRNPGQLGEVGQVRIDRTIGFDSSHSQYMRKQVVLPQNARELGEPTRDVPYKGWYKQMMSQVRMVDKDGRNNYTARYVQIGGHDHWDHSDLYEWTASTLVGPSITEIETQQEGIVTADELGYAPEEFDELILDDDHDDDWLDSLGVE